MDSAAWLATWAENSDFFMVARPGLTERMAAFLRSSAASTLFPLQGDDGVETCRLIGGLEAEEDADHG